MKFKTLIKTSAAMLAFLALSNCYLDGDYEVFDSPVERGQAEGLTSQSPEVLATQPDYADGSEALYPSI